MNFQNETEILIKKLKEYLSWKIQLPKIINFFPFNLFLVKKIFLKFKNILYGTKRSDQLLIQMTECITSLNQALHVLHLSQQNTSYQNTSDENKLINTDNYKLSFKTQNKSFIKESTFNKFYMAFENRFRGSRVEIKARQTFYLPYVTNILKEKDKLNILDLGCGRGEWLELLKEKNISAIGVDNNPFFIKECHTYGLNVIKDDALHYITKLPAESLNVISSFHFIEHIPFEYLFALLQQAYRVLQPNGVLILETPNPENIIMGSCNFYVDPTHRNPIPAISLEFLLHYMGFSRNEIVHPLTPKESLKITNNTLLNQHVIQRFFYSPDYGIIAYK